jgi:NAD/NADP transhydrogenase alpha subunit
MSDDYKRQQAELVAEHIAKQDVVITTALIPGRPAPKLVSEKMVKSMKPGSIIVDLAAERGGNCELTKPGEIIVTENEVKIVGSLNLAGKVPATSSQLIPKTC